MGRPIAFTLFAFLVSYLAAAFFNTTPHAWPLVERVPQPIAEKTVKILAAVFGPVLPTSVHEQEEMLELLMVWLCSGLALLPIVVFTASVWHEFRRRRFSSDHPPEAP